MHALVTGAAGFVGSHLAEALLDAGYAVRGIDCFTPYYDVAQKRSNVVPLLEREGFSLVEANLLDGDLKSLLDGIDVVFHQAGQPGVRLSWADQFRTYVDLNVVATQRLLEAARAHGDLHRFVYASSSSVYGNAERYPTLETDLPAPFSPYGVTKLAAEHLCNLYAANSGLLPVVSLRYFTVYGPRQRPDMAFHRLMECALTGTVFELYGTGEQIRDFTFVHDVVVANIRAAESDVSPGTVVNIAGGGSTSMAEVIDLIGRLNGTPVDVERRPAQSGDVARTGGSIERAEAILGWRPSVGLEEGLARQLEWHRRRRPAATAD
jgi:UDP-glucuronate 4-epimerase